MRVEQTSATTFELTTDNGCIALAAFATNTIGAPGVYICRSEKLSQAEADAAFRADPRVLDAIAKAS